MRIDASEVKTFRECERKHLYSSRNRFHLQPVAPNDNLVFGTQFHEVLAMMYLGTPLEKIRAWVTKEVTGQEACRMMLNMLDGYYWGPYQEDKERYEVVDIEKSFEYPVSNDPELSFAKDENGKYFAYDLSTGDTYYDPIVVCGSIDMICIDKSTGQLVGFEHKTAKNFRPDVYNFVDEQPRLYTWALKHILDDYHSQGKYLSITKTGPIYLNQVKKLISRFAYCRSECRYTEDSIDNFMEAFVRTAEQIKWTNPKNELPEPGYMKCQMCDYADLCMHYDYDNIDLEDLKDEFEGEFMVRDHDHLEEKAHRHVETREEE